jgi:hypothetical protein
MKTNCQHHWEIIGHYVHQANVVRKCSLCNRVEVQTYDEFRDQFEWMSLSDIDLRNSVRPEDTELTYTEMNELKQLQSTL